MIYNPIIYSGSSGSSSQWVRPSDWLPIDNLVNEGEQKFVGLHLINEYSNFVSLTASGNYTVNWGDGVVENFASGVQAYHVFNYADFVGTESERGYRQAIVTVTPQAGQNLTSINLNKKHNQVGLQKYASGWLDIKMSAPFLTTLYISQATTYVNHYNLEQFDFVGENLLTSCSYMFYDIRRLLNVKNFNTASVTNMSVMFYNCNSLQTVPLFNTASVTSMSTMFQNCTSLQTVPLFNTASVTNMNNMFQYCTSLQTVPLFNTASVTNMSYMFNNCYSLQTVPLFNTASVTNMSTMFQNCTSLQKSSLLNTKVEISYQNCSLSKEALVEIFQNLYSPVTSKTITITGNWGASLLTDDDRLIATSKGWTIAS